MTDFASVSTASFFDLLIVTRAGSPLHTVGDLIKAAQANPGKLNIGTIVPGSTQNLAALLFNSTAGIKATVVTFRTSPDMANAVMRGDVDVAFEFYRGGPRPARRQKIAVLASTGAKRTAYLPNVPTVIESGLKDYDVASWNGLSFRPRRRSLSSTAQRRDEGCHPRPGHPGQGATWAWRCARARRRR